MLVPLRVFRDASDSTTVSQLQRPRETPRAISYWTAQLSGILSNSRCASLECATMQIPDSVDGSSAFRFSRRREGPPDAEVTTSVSSLKLTDFWKVSEIRVVVGVSTLERYELGDSSGFACVPTIRPERDGVCGTGSVQRVRVIFPERADVGWTWAAGDGAA